MLLKPRVQYPTGTFKSHVKIKRSILRKRKNENRDYVHRR